MEILLFLFIIITFVVIWIIKTQNSLVVLDEQCKNALSQIGVQQESRWDVLTNIISLIDKYSKHESETLKEIISLRSKGDTVSDINNIENEINKAIKVLDVVVEAYPDLKAEKIYQESISSMNQYEKDVKYSRMIYNDSITKLNRKVRQIPTSLIAGLLGFTQKEYLETNEDKSDMPKI